MGKIDKTRTDKPNKMLEMLSERRKNNPISTHLKRSKSVRASIRSIGNKLLLQKNTQNMSPLSQKSASISNLAKCNFKRNLLNSNLDSGQNDIRYPVIFEKEPVKTILKTPMIYSNDQKVCKNQLAVLGFKKDQLGKNKEQLEHNLMLTTPPAKVAPKAAAVLEIPIKENCEPIFYRKEKAVDRRLLSQRQSLIIEKYGKSDGFNRNSFRLSMIRKKNNNIWNYSFSSMTSM